MIRITVELLPVGDESRKRKLASAEIFNTGKGTHEYGIYGFRLFGKDGRIMREGALGAFLRQKFTIWWLIAATLKVAFPDVARSFIGGKIESGLVDPEKKAAAEAQPPLV